MLTPEKPPGEFDVARPAAEPTRPPTERSGNRIEGSIVTKMLAGAVVVPVPVAVVALRVMAKTHGEKANIDPVFAILLLASSALVGAILGAMMAAKDRVEQRLEKGLEVAAPMRLLFGRGLWSVLCVWLPIVFFVSLILLPLVLSVKPF